MVEQSGAQVGWLLFTQNLPLWTLKQETETDDNHATMKESFSLVRNILSQAKPNTSKYPPYPSTAKYPVWAQYSPVQPSAAQHSLGAPLQPNAAGKFPASLERFQPVWKVSSQSEKFPTRLESFQSVASFQLSWKVSRQREKFPHRLESFRTVSKYSTQSGKFPQSLESKGNGGWGSVPLALTVSKWQGFS